MSELNPVSQKQQKSRNLIVKESYSFHRHSCLLNKVLFGLALLFSQHDRHLHMHLVLVCLLFFRFFLKNTKVEVLWSHRCPICCWHQCLHAKVLMLLAYWHRLANCILQLGNTKVCLVLFSKESGARGILICLINSSIIIEFQWNTR